MGVRILIVDDNEDLRNLLAEALQADSHKAHMAPGVKEAISLMKMNNYDIIITDKNIPGKEDTEEGGMHVLRCAKKLLPSAEILIMTGFASLDTVIEALRNGAFDYLKKPFRLNELKEKINRIIEYKSFSNPKDIISTYKNLFNEILNLARKKHSLNDQELNQSLRSIFNKIDYFFKLQKERDKAFSNISSNLEKLKENVSRSDPLYNYIINIRKEVDKQLQRVH